MTKAHTVAAAAIMFAATAFAQAQIDSTLLRRTAVDTAAAALSMDAAYRRPFMSVGRSPISLGGYMEVSWQHLGTNGVTEGHQFQFRRLTLFVSSSITERIRFLSEIEFEDGAKEIAVEFAAIDVEFDPLMNLRGGMIVNPIGGFNQNHDGPKWEFVDRPIAATEMLPATWSNAGIGLYGKHSTGDWLFGYEFYLSGGFDNSIIANSSNRTSLPAAKENPDRFEEIASGKPLITAKIAARNSEAAELGISYMGGVYNKWQEDGLTIDTKRRCDVFDVDLNTTLPFGTQIIGEWAWVFVDVPSTYSQQFGERQRGGFVDLVHPIIRGGILGWEASLLNLACRVEYVDWNVGTFRETGGNIADDLWSVMPAVSFRPTPGTVIRLNYRIQKQRDLLGNPSEVTGGFLFGFSSYF
ncbi:MAG: hypothetical protein AB1428_15370 [Bacteroidota bacterium]